MIYASLSCLTDEINEYFKSRLKIIEDKVVLSAIVNQDGTIAINGENKIIVTMVNVEKETLANGTQKGSFKMSNSAPPININVNILFSAYFSQNNYPESLRFLSYVISFFQYKNVFTRSNTTSLHGKIDKLVFEMIDLNPDSMSNMWSTIGAKYMPSVLYKMRMLTFDESITREFRPLVSRVLDEHKISKGPLKRFLKE